jgi:E3 ubiquitin-protein ligase HUWE1
MLEVRQLLAKVTEASDDELPSLLGGISEWCWPRGDLHYWIHILNRFDSILEETCRDYDLHKLQINEFTPLRKRIVVSILKFSRLLIENCTSRKLYSSYEVSTNAIFKRAVDMCRC